MIVYWGILLWVVVIGLYQSKYSDTVLVGNTNEFVAHRGYGFFLFFAVIFFAGMCTDCIDRGTYIRTFSMIPTQMEYFNDYIDSREGNTLYYGCQMIFKCYISQNSTMWMMAIALLHGLCLIKGLKPYTPDMAMSAFLFVASNLAVSWMYNGIRQFIVVAILFANGKLLLTNKWWKLLLLCVFLAGLSPVYSILGLGKPIWFLGGVHESAWVFVPMIFIVRGKAWNKKMWFLILITAFLALTDGFSSLISTAAENSSYAADLKYIQSDTGSSIIRTLVSLVPVALAFFARQQIMEEAPDYIHLCINMSTVTAAMYFVSSLTSGFFIGRLPIYTELYNLILIPWLIIHCYKKNEKLFLYGARIAYLFYFMFQMYVAWGGLYYSSSPLGIFIY